MTKIESFDESLNFTRRFGFLRKIWIFEENLDFLRKFLIFGEKLNFDEMFGFTQNGGFLTKGISQKCLIGRPGIERLTLGRPGNKCCLAMLAFPQFRHFPRLGDIKNYHPEVRPNFRITISKNLNMNI